jgi:hypothetical protein
MVAMGSENLRVLCVPFASFALRCLPFLYDVCAAVVDLWRVALRSTRPTNYAAGSGRIAFS